MLQLIQSGKNEPPLVTDNTTLSTGMHNLIKALQALDNLLIITISLIAVRIIIINLLFIKECPIHQA